jgi:hypothetical protein
VVIQPAGRAVFGVCISYQASGEMCRYIVYIQNGQSISMRRSLLEDELVKYASGYWPSAYNPKKEDLFSKNGLACKVIFDSSRWKDYPLCSPMDSLWKLRFKSHPFDNKADPGWSNREYRPSSNQEKYLFSEFNIKNIDRDFFVDANFWKLLRDVSDSDWIDKYKNIP